MEKQQDTMHQQNTNLRVDSLQQLLVVIQEFDLVMRLQRSKETFVLFVGCNKEGSSLRQDILDVVVNLVCTNSGSFELEIASTYVKGIKFTKLFSQVGNDPGRGTLDWVLVSNVVSVNKASQ